MLIYLFIFICSGFLFYLSEKPELSKYRKCFVFFAIMLPSMLAGLRSENVGVDVKIYAIPIYEDAVSSSGLLSFLQNQWVLQNKDIAFNALCYFLSRISSDYHLGLFSFQLITLSFSYLGMKIYKEKYNTPVWFGMVVYLLILYNPSLNIMRQCIAVSILFFGIVSFMNKKFFCYLTCQIAAFFFHSSSILGIGIVLMYLILMRRDNQTLQEQIYRGIFFVMCAVGAVIMLPAAVKMLVNLGVLREYYLGYLPGGIYSVVDKNVSINILSIMPSVFYLIFMFFAYRNMNMYKKESLFLLFSSFILLGLDFAPLYAQYLNRIGYYFLPFRAVMLSDISSVLDLKLKKGYQILIVLALLTVWIVTVVLLKYYGTMPYEFFIRIGE